MPKGANHESEKGKGGGKANGDDGEVSLLSVPESAHERRKKFLEEAARRAEKEALELYGDDDGPEPPKVPKLATDPVKTLPKAAVRSSKAPSKKTTSNSAKSVASQKSSSSKDAIAKTPSAAKNDKEKEKVAIKVKLDSIVVKAGPKCKKPPPTSHSDSETDTSLDSIYSAEESPGTKKEEEKTTKPSRGTSPPQSTSQMPSITERVVVESRGSANDPLFLDEAVNAGPSGSWNSVDVVTVGVEDNNLDPPPRYHIQPLPDQQQAQVYANYSVVPANAKRIWIRDARDSVTQRQENAEVRRRQFDRDFEEKWRRVERDFAEQRRIEIQRRRDENNDFEAELLAINVLYKSEVEKGQSQPRNTYDESFQYHDAPRKNRNGWRGAQSNYGAGRRSRGRSNRGRSWDNVRNDAGGAREQQNYRPKPSELNPIRPPSENADEDDESRRSWRQERKD